jgi:uncharacterized protein with NRDE domain
MCLIAIAHRASPVFPLVIAANRDEDHLRPTRPAHWWDDAPHVLGGRDAQAGGGWLAISKDARFAAVTNLRGAVRRDRSRGALVRGFVTGNAAPLAYAAAIDVAQYSGFHLLTGEIGGELTHLSEAAVVLDAGIHGVSNAPHGEHWPKVGLAVDAVREALSLDDADALVDALLRFLSTPRHTGRIEDEPFIAGDRYGTRASTVIVATGERVTFAEQNFGPGGVAAGELRRFSFSSAAAR